MGYMIAGHLRGVLVAALALSAIAASANTFDVTPDTSSGVSTSYQWSIDIDLAGASGNPDLIVLTGQTYNFNVSMNSFHPFWIDTEPGIGGVAPYEFPSDALSDNGVTNATTIKMNLPANAPDTLYYACGSHASMHGTITVVHDLVFRAAFD